MKRILSFLNKYKKEVVLGPLFKLIEATFELFIPLVVANIIDKGIGEKSSSVVIKGSLLMILLGVLGLVFSVVAQFFCARAAVGFATDIREALFKKIQTFSYSRLDKIGTSALLARLTGDANTMQNGVNLVLRLVLRSPFIVIGAAVMAFYVDPESAFWFVIVIPVLSVVIYALMKATVPLHKRVQKKLEGVMGLCEETISGARVIRAFAAEDNEAMRFTEENRQMYSLQKKAGRLSSLMNPVTYVIINAATIALLWTGAVRVDSGAIKVGAVVALFNYMSQILIELLKFANVIVNVTKSVASAHRVEDVLFAPEDTLPEPDTRDLGHKVVFENVTLRYNKDADPSLENISFFADEGDTVGIIGGTGSGKTSLINLIGGHYVPESGTVAVDGRDVLSYERDTLLKKIGVVPQKAVLFKGTVRDNLLWGKGDCTDDELFEALRLSMALDFVMEKGGLDAPVEQGGRNFSGGQRQRLTIARALCRRPEILILDDSSSALDFATDAALRKNLRSLDYSPTVFIVSQRTSSIMHADTIVVLDEGQAVGVGTHEELLMTSAVYKEIYDSQFRKGGDRQ